MRGHTYLARSHAPEKRKDTISEAEVDNVRYLHNLDPALRDQLSQIPHMKPPKRFGTTVTCLEEHVKNYRKSVRREVQTAVYAILTMWKDTAEPPQKRKHGVHDDIIEELETKLESTNDYCFLLKNKLYSHAEHNGEIDLLGIQLTDDGLYYSYFEVKSSTDSACMKKGKKQIHKWMTYMHDILGIPYSHLKGAIVTPGKEDLQFTIIKPNT